MYVQLLHGIFLIYDQCIYSPENRYTNIFSLNTDEVRQRTRLKYMYVCMYRYFTRSRSACASKSEGGARTCSIRFFPSTSQQLIKHYFLTVCNFMTEISIKEFAGPEQRYGLLIRNTYIHRGMHGYMYIHIYKHTYTYTYTYTLTCNAYKALLENIRTFQFNRLTAYVASCACMCFVCVGSVLPAYMSTRRRMLPERENCSSTRRIACTASA